MTSQAHGSMVKVFTFEPKVMGSNLSKGKTNFYHLFSSFFIKLQTFLKPIKTSHFEMIFCTLVI